MEAAFEGHVASEFSPRKRHRDDGRILEINAALINDWTITYGLHDIRGYDPPQPSLRLFRLWRVAEPGQLDWMASSMSSLSPTVLQIASVLGAKSRLDPRREAMVVRGDLVRADAAVLGAASGGVAGSAGPARGPAGPVTVDDASTARVVLHASLPQPGLVVLNDGWAPGWSVDVDGRDATEVRVNETMRGVVVGAGAHEVEWRCRVPGLRVGAELGLVAVVVMVGLGLSGLWLRNAKT